MIGSNGIQNSSRGSEQKLEKESAKATITLIRDKTRSMVDIPTYLATPVTLGHKSTITAMPVINFGRHQPANIRQIIPDMKFRRAILGVGVFLIILSTILVGTVMWFSYTYTDKEIERNFLKLYNRTDNKDMYSYIN